MNESEKLRGRGTVLGFDAGNEDLRMRSVEKYSLSNKTKDREPCALKGASTVRGGGHAIPVRVNGPYSTPRLRQGSTQLLHAPSRCSDYQASAGVDQGAGGCGHIRQPAATSAAGRSHSAFA
jgi:hypothetical protein